MFRRIAGHTYALRVLGVIAVVMFGIFALIAYYDRPDKIVSYSYAYQFNGTLLNFFEGTTEPVTTNWKLAFNLTTSDVISAETKIRVNVIGRAYSSTTAPNTGTKIIFPTGFPEQKQYVDGHALPAEIILEPDPVVPDRFTGHTTLVWQDAGSKCIVIVPRAIQTQSEFSARCPPGIDPVFDLPPAEEKRQFEFEMEIKAFTIFGIGIAICGIAFGITRQPSTPSLSNRG